MFKVKGDYYIEIGIVFCIEVKKDVISGLVYVKGMVLFVIFMDVMVLYGLKLSFLLDFFVNVLK